MGYFPTLGSAVSYNDSLQFLVIIERPPTGTWVNPQRQRQLLRNETEVPRLQISEDLFLPRHFHDLSVAFCPTQADHRVTIIG